MRKGSKTTLSEANVADLGAERLAAILLDLSSDSHVKRVLRLELFAEASAEGLALEISKRLATIGKSSSASTGASALRSPGTWISIVG